MLFKNIVSTRSVLIKKSIEDRFNPTFWYSEDYWLWLNLLHKGKKLLSYHFIYLDIIKNLIRIKAYQVIC